MQQDAHYYPEVRKWMHFWCIGNYKLEIWQASFAIIEKQPKFSLKKAIDLFKEVS